MAWADISLPEQRENMKTVQKKTQAVYREGAEGCVFCSAIGKTFSRWNGNA